MDLLVLTGGRGEIARAISAHAHASGWRVQTVERGDDLDAAMSEARAVLVLEAARPGAVSGDYRTALRAVACALGGATAPTVASITMLPPREPARTAFEEAASVAEEEMRAARPGFTAIRTSMVVGTLEREGPNDRALRATGPLKLLPTPGTQRVRPIVVEDLARIAVAALEPPHEDRVVAEGPAEPQLDELVRQLNGSETRIVHYRPWLLDAIGVFLPFVAHRKRQQLPTSDFLIAEGSPSERVLGVDLESVAEAWPEEDRKSRRRREVQRHAHGLYRTTRASGLVAAFLVGLGLLAGYVGVHDALVSSTLSLRLSGITLVVAGLFVTGCGGALLARYWPHRYTAGFLGSAVALVLLITVWLTALAGGDAPLTTLFVGGYLIVAALTACVMLWRRGHLAVAEFFRKGGAARVSAIVLGSTAIALLQFLYASVYVPSTAQPTVNVTASIEPGRPSHGRRPVTFAFTLKNPTSHSVNILAGSYELDGLDGRRGGARESLGDPELAAEWAPYVNYSGRLRMDADETAPHVVEIGNVVTPGTFIEPGEQLDRKVVVYAPPRFRTFRGRIDLVVSRRRFEEQLDFGADISGGERPRLEAKQRIEDPSLLHDVTRGERWIHAVRSLDAEPLAGCLPTALVVYVDNEERTDAMNGACSERADELRKHYGISGAEILVEATRGEDEP